MADIEIISFQGGCGDCIANAVEIVGAVHFASGIHAEFDYIDSIYKMENIEDVSAKIVFAPGKVYHKINIISISKAIKDIYFDASEFHFNVNSEDVDMIKEVMDYIN